MTNEFPEINLNNVLLHNLLTFLVKSTIIVIVGLLLSKIIRKVLYNLITAKRTQQRETLAKVSDKIIKISFYFLIISMVLDVFGISISSLIAVAGIGSVAIGFGAQSLVKDFFNGLLIILENQFSIGDIVEVGGKEGIVEEVGIRTTLVRDLGNNALYTIPNSKIDIVTNYTESTHRAVVDIDVPYTLDIDSTISLIKNAVTNFSSEGVLETPRVLGVTSFKDSSMNIKIVCDCELGEAFRVKREILRLLKYTFDKENIEIPYPTQTIYIANREEEL